MIKWQLRSFASLDSTNRLLFRDAGSCDLPEGHVYVTDYQHAGKGLGSNTWVSSSGCNVLCSILLKPKLSAIRQFDLSKIVSLALSDVLGEYVKDVSVKWPNDLWVGQRKIAGMLIENSLAGSKIRYSVVGVGLNVNQTDFPADVSNPTSLALLTGEAHDRALILQQFLDALAVRYEHLQKKKNRYIHQEYMAKLYKSGVEATYKSAGKIFSGTITGVDETGRLKIAMRDGSWKTFFFKEVEFIH
jgi:BirA family transcriptional regulator, biotin operon repressor / biotin---[acetyl-CoA-carboxylase] ligase